MFWILEVAHYSCMESKLEMAARHVVRGRQIIIEQETRVERLRARGLDPAFAIRLLTTFRRTQAVFEDDYEWVLARKD